jgi:hypothetical protein
VFHVKQCHRKIGNSSWQPRYRNPGWNSDSCSCDRLLGQGTVWKLSASRIMNSRSIAFCDYAAIERFWATLKTSCRLTGHPVSLISRLLGWRSLPVLNKIGKTRLIDQAKHYNAQACQDYSIKIPGSAYGYTWSYAYLIEIRFIPCWRKRGGIREAETPTGAAIVQNAIFGR